MDTVISVCGDCCSECPRYKATQSNSISELEYVAQLWFRLGLRDRVVSIDEISCTGCNKKANCVYNLTTCEHLNGKENCGECRLFPCSKLYAVFKNSDLSDENCKSKCSEDEYLQLKRAFFSKKEILSKINKSIFNKPDQG